MPSEPDIITSYEDWIYTAAACLVEHMGNIGTADMSTTLGQDLCSVPKHDALLILIAMVGYMPAKMQQVMLAELSRQIRENPPGKHRRLKRLLTEYGMNVGEF